MPLINSVFKTLIVIIFIINCAEWSMHFHKRTHSPRYQHTGKIGTKIPVSSLLLTNAKCRFVIPEGIFRNGMWWRKITWQTDPRKWRMLAVWIWFFVETGGGGGDGDSRLQISDHVSEEQSSGEQRPTNKQKEGGWGVGGGILRVGLNITNAYQRRNEYQLAFVDFSASMRLKLWHWLYFTPCCKAFRAFKDLSTLCVSFFFFLVYTFIADHISISTYIMCVMLCLFSTLSRREGT